MADRAHNAALRSPAFWYRLVLCLVAVIGFFTGDRHAAFFTSIANTVVLGYYAVAVWWMLSRRTAAGPAPVLRGGVAAWIVVVALIAHVQLNHGQFPDLTVTDPSTLLDNWSLTIIHYVIPVMVLVDWIAFGPRGLLRWWHPLVWSAFPVVYILITVLRGALFPFIEDAYPYPFLEPDGRTPGGIIVGTLSMLPVVVAICYAVYGIGKGMNALARLSGRGTSRARSARPA